MKNIITAIALFALCFFIVPKASFAQEQAAPGEQAPEVQTSQQQEAPPEVQQEAAPEVQQAPPEAQEQAPAQASAPESPVPGAEETTGAQKLGAESSSPYGAPGMPSGPPESLPTAKAPEPSPELPEPEPEPDPKTDEPPSKRDEGDIADKALGAAESVTQAKTSGHPELDKLLAKFEAIKEDVAAFTHHEIVELRLHLQRFRGHSEATAQRVDEASAHLNNVLNDKAAPQPGNSITGQSRNLPE